MKFMNEGNLGNLTKREIVLSIYEENDYQQKDVKDIVQKTLDCVFDALASGRNIELRSFGVFELQVRKPRPGRNPKKPEDVVTIPERIAVKFKPGKELKEKLKKLPVS
jgi:nucleoid DNA-binding protein